MYEISKTFWVSAAHYLTPPYAGPCTELHGHNYRITVHCRSDVLDERGFVLDFSEVKKLVMNRFDHAVINTIVKQPTAENMAAVICELIGPKCYRVDVEETEGSVASYVRD